MSVRRRSFLQSAGAVLLLLRQQPASIARGAAPYDAFEKSISDLQADMAAGKTSAAELVRFYLGSHQRVRSGGAASERRAVSESERRRRCARAGRRAEENGDRAVRCTASPSSSRTTSTPGTCPRPAARWRCPASCRTEDAFQVRKLRQAGAVILGKVNLHELALGLTTVSSLGGQTLDPYDLTRAPGGSSGGSGVAASANFAAFAMGTDTSGSIRIPSSHNAIVGLRPSAGLSSRAGIIPFGHTQDTGGPMAQDGRGHRGRSRRDRRLRSGRSRHRVEQRQDSAVVPSSLTRARRARTRPHRRADGILRQRAGGRGGRRDRPDGDRRHETAGRDRASMSPCRICAAQLAASNLLTQELKFYLGDYLKSVAGRGRQVRRRTAGVRLACRATAGVSRGRQRACPTTT